MAWKYIGEGYVPGIPARDLTDAEGELYKVSENGAGLYTHIDDAAPVKRRK